MSHFRADLHCHTYCSDGSDSPETLLRKAKAIGLQGLSITDHDSIGAYTPEVFALADALPIRLLPGIELSSEWEKTTVHVLGYGIDIHSEGLREFLAEMIRRRNTRNQAIIEKLKAQKIAIEMAEVESLTQELFSHRTIGRPHIAELLVRKKVVASIPEAFDRYLREGAICYVSGIKYTPTDVIDAIHHAKGKAVLAHPHFIKSGSHLRYLLTLPFDGLECHYGTLHKVQEKYWIKKAKEKGLIATGGSDYHGACKP
ncbi:MAG TPA: PHP domain-containing protein, partial [Chlamydiales bacterium]|nr:PHP domain-containing protein [Chlamydiales bacterium]